MNESTVIARAPGRVNLIGDHTDYTGGRCLPMAIDRWVEVAGDPQADSSVVFLRSDAEDAAVKIPLDIVDTTRGPEWGRYVAAVVKRVRPAQGFRGVVRSDLPIGAGLSSSAALEVATALALGADAASPLALAAMCRDAEHEARGVPTGLLDQLASILGVAGHALVLDCSTNTVTATPLPPSDEAEVVVVAGAPRHLASTGYAKRVEECRRVEEEIGPLRDATPDDVEALGDPTLRKRARHVVTENARVGELAASLAEGRLAEAGQIMNASHASLRDDYESSTTAVDEVCEELRGMSGVFGARITGGGWGGAIVVLAAPGVLEGRGWVVHAVDGASVRLAGPAV